MSSHHTQDTSATRTLLLDIALTPEQMLDVYSGAVHTVVTRARDGRTVSMPISVLRPFVTHSGIRGTFAVSVDRHNRFLAIERLPAPRSA